MVEDSAAMPMIALPYRDDIRGCPKCGMGYGYRHGLPVYRPELRWCAGCPEHSEEHWHRECPRCGYAWLEQLAARPEAEKPVVKQTIREYIFPAMILAWIASALIYCIVEMITHVWGGR